MLILTRKAGEGVQIGNDIVIGIVGFNQRGIEIGIEAPREFNVIRLGREAIWGSNTAAEMNKMLREGKK